MNVDPVAIELPPLAAVYQLICEEEDADRSTVPVPHLEPSVTDGLAG